jgi:hypothetical protein
VDFSVGGITITTPRPVTMYLEPKENAQKKVLPAQTKKVENSSWRNVRCGKVKLRNHEKQLRGMVKPT